MATERRCIVDDCSTVLTGRGEGRGMCSLHYQRWRKHDDVAYQRPGRSVCTIADCHDPVIGRGWCSKHYTRWLRYGDATARMDGEVRDGKRVCPGCRVDKPTGAYTKATGACRGCVAARTRARRVVTPDTWRAVYDPVVGRAKAAAWRKANPEKVRAQTARRRARRRGATVGDPFLPSQVFDRDGWVCGLCETDIDPSVSYPDPRSASVDHIVPLARGGEHSLANVQAAHLNCNVRKGARLTEGVA